MIYKYIKCESVIAKIMADLDISEKNQRITDIREWIFEAIEKIGAPMQYIQKQSDTTDCPIFEIHDYQIPIPDDLVYLDNIAYAQQPKGNWQPMRISTSSFPQPHKSFNPGISGQPHQDVNAVQGEQIEHQPMQYKIPTSQSQFWTVNGVKYLKAALAEGRGEEPQYIIKPGWIVTNKREGFVKLAYKAVATDERGYPLIPDLQSYQEAIYWYVTMKMSFPKFLNGTLGGKSRNNGNVYTYIHQQWNFYRNQAYAEAMMPTEGDMRGIKNEWNKLIPEWDADDTFFDKVGAKQANFNDYYYGY